jgi:pimeloyl-ACP methyl ester carboxylesterase
VRATIRPILASILVVLTVLATAAPAAARPDPEIEWRPCPDDATAQCGTLSVPVDWADPYSPRIAIALAERPATDPAHRLGTLIVNPGGPGGSGVSFVLSAGAVFSRTLRARFDIVGFDPRGVGLSDPIACSPALLAAAPSPLIAGRAEYDATIAYNRRLAADCRARTGPVFDHVDTMSVVRDTEAVRAALGADKINFYGASYGTLLGAQYAERYPHRVRAVVLDSVMDHSAGVDDFLGTETAAVQDAFDQFVAWCARDVTCVLHGRDVGAIWSGLMSRAAAGTLIDPYDPTHRVTVFDLISVAFSSFYDPQWYTLAYYLQRAQAETPVAPAGKRAVDRAADSFAAVFCADWALPIHGYADLAGKLATLRSRAPQMLASPLALTATTGCLGWPSPPVNPQRALGPAATPILLVNARYDPATAYAWAQHVAAQLGPAATLFTYDGWSHVAYGRSDCVTGAIDAYLISGRPPAPGSSCPGVIPPPFGVG